VPAKSAVKILYKVSFANRDKVYEVYARSVSQSGLFGFVELEELVFGEKSSVVVDPSEEKLRTEFAGVRRSHVPMHSIIRIDEVDARTAGEHPAKITDDTKGDSNVTPFPIYTNSQTPGSST